MPVSRAPKCTSRVVPLRSGPVGGSERYMTRGPCADKSHRMRFSFPVRPVKREDCLEGMLRRCLGLMPMEARKILGSELTPELSLGHWIAGIRTLYEEIGVLFCTTADGPPKEETHGSMAQNLERKRSQLVNGDLDLKSIIESEGLFCDVGHLRYLSNWSQGSPETSMAAHGERYFLAPLPSYHNGPANPHLESNGLWMTPEGALDQFEKGKFSIEFSTFASIRTLADFDSLESVWDGLIG